MRDMQEKTLVRTDSAARGGAGDRGAEGGPLGEDMWTPTLGVRLKLRTEGRPCGHGIRRDTHLIAPS